MGESPRFRTSASRYHFTQPENSLVIVLQLRLKPRRLPHHHEAAAGIQQLREHAIFDPALMRFRAGD